MESLLYFAAGSLVSWLITMVYYRKSSVSAPVWAHELIRKLPEKPISEEDFAHLLKEHMNGLVIDGGTY